MNDPGVHRRASELFATARDLPEQERQEWLGRECGDDATLRAAVEDLLYNDIDDAFLEPDARATEALADALRGESKVPQAPHSFGHFTLLHELGRGGQGTVWLAEDERLKRRVALKILQTTGEPDAHQIGRFQREAEAAGKLDHANICALFDAGEIEGVPFLAYRFVDGQTLAQRIAETQPTTAESSSKTGIYETVAMFEKLARALHTAHERGLIHRDIKPSNIMVTADGEPVVLDFGLAREESGEMLALTHSGDLLGTPAYMSPEQLMAQRVPLDRRTDVYSLGATLYEALTLERPFHAATRAALYQQILHSEVPAASSRNRQIPRDVEIVLMTAMERDRNRRYQTALDFAEDLRRCRQREPIRARPIGTWLRLRRFAQRRPAAATAFVLILAGLILSLVSVERIRRERNTARAAALGAAATWMVAEDPAVALLLALESVEVDPDNLENVTALHLALREVREKTLVDLDGSHRPAAIAFSPDERRIAVGQTDSVKIVAWQVGELEVLPQPSHVHDVAFSPDGDGLAIACADATIRVARLHDSDTEPLAITGHDQPVRSVAFAADGRLLSASADGTARLWSSNDGFRRHFEQRRVLRPDPDATVKSAQFTQHGERILTVTDTGVLALWHASEPAADLLAPAGIEDLTDDPRRETAISADASILASGLRNHLIWDLSGTAPPVRPRHRSAVTAVAMCAARPGVVLTGSADQTARLTDARSGMTLAEFRGHRGRILDAAFSGSGNLVATAGQDGTLRVWNSRSATLPTIHAHAHGVQHLGVLPNGTIVTRARSRRASEGSLGWRTPDGELIAEVQLPGTNMFSLATGGSVARLHDEGRILQIWSDQGTLENAFELPNGPWDHVACSPHDPDLVLLRNEKAACLYRAGAEQPERVFDLPGFPSAWPVFHPNGRWWAEGSSDQRGAALRSVDGEEVRELDVAGRTYRLAFSPDGRWLVAAIVAGDAALWDLLDPDSRPVRLRGHAGETCHVAISPDSKIIATGSRDKVARLWNLRGECIAILRGHTSLVWRVRFSPDGQRLHTASFDGTVRTWFVDPRELLTAARSSAPRQLTAEERRRFAHLLAR